MDRRLLGAVLTRAQPVFIPLGLPPFTTSCTPIVHKKLCHTGFFQRPFKMDKIARISTRQFLAEVRFRSSSMTMVKTHTQTRRNRLTAYSSPAQPGRCPAVLPELRRRTGGGTRGWSPCLDWLVLPTNSPVPVPDSRRPDRRPERVSPLRLVGYGLGALAATTAGTWILAELATPDGIGLVTADLSGLGRTVGLIAAAAVGVPAAVLAYHRQRALDTANRTAASQHEHKVQTDHLEHRTGRERHLRERYTTCAEQLGHENSAIRLAGIYALASLADDWHGLGKDSERQVCIDLLCAYLRSRRRPAASAGVFTGNETRSTDQSEEEQVRTAIIGVIRARTSTMDGLWTECHFDLSGADLPVANLSYTTLNRVNLANATLNGANLSNATLIRADLAGANLVNARLDTTDLSGADLTGANLVNARLDTADLTLAKLTDADLTKVDLNFATLTEANMSGANLTRADLTNAKMSGADLTGATLAFATLSNADLTPTSETVQSNPTLADMRSWRQMERILSLKDISGLSRSATILVGADLTGAVLNGADLTNANLSAADLTGANLANATLDGTDRTGAVWMDES